jgi:hypothetical protein
MSTKSMGIDPAYGSSAFGIVVTQFVDGQIQIIYAEEFKRPDFNEMLNKVRDLHRRYNITSFYVDGANPSFIRSLKIEFDEDPDYDSLMSQYRREERDVRKEMIVVPVHFSTEHKAMLGHAKILLEKQYIAINPKFEKLITSLRTAVEDEGSLDRESTAYHDIFDAFRLALHHYEFTDEDD